MKVEWTLFTSTVCKCSFGVWIISQVDLLVFQMALGHHQALCKCWFGFATVCDMIPWNGSCDAVIGFP